MVRQKPMGSYRAGDMSCRSQNHLCRTSLQTDHRSCLGSVGSTKQRGITLKFLINVLNKMTMIIVLCSRRKHGPDTGMVGSILTHCSWNPHNNLLGRNHGAHFPASGTKMTSALVTCSGPHSERVEVPGHICISFWLTNLCSFCRAYTARPRSLRASKFYPAVSLQKHKTTTLFISLHQTVEIFSAKSSLPPVLY